MRILVHSEDATYNPATKQWVFTLDRRISNPTRIVVQQNNYSASITTNYPLTVYVRSSGLTNLSRDKHTVELKGADVLKLVDGAPLVNPVGITRWGGNVIVVDSRARSVFSIDSEGQLTPLVRPDN